MAQPELSRRQLVTYAGTAVAAVAAPIALSGTASAATAVRRRAVSTTVAKAAANCTPTDVLIIGSGYSGSVAALRYAQLGIESVVLERGQRWKTTPAGNTFATPAAPDGRASWFNATSPLLAGVTLPVQAGVLEAFYANGIIALAGAGVGGGSLVNNAVIMQPTETLFNQSWNGILSYNEMNEIWYPRAKALIGASPLPSDVLASSYYENARAFLNEATLANLDPYLVDMAINWDVVRGEMNGTKTPSVIIGNSIWGVNSGAKLSVDQTILAEAEATGLVTVQPLTEVLDIQLVAGRYVVSCQVIDVNGNILSKPTYSASQVLLGAGSLGTTRLLVRAKAIGSLPALSSAIGTNWGTNGDAPSMWSGMAYNNPTQGGPSGVVARDYTSNPYAPVTALNFPWSSNPTNGTGAIASLLLAPVPPLGTFAYQASSDSVELTWPSTDPRVTNGVQAAQYTARSMAATDSGASLQFTNPGMTSHSVGGVGLTRGTRADGSLLGYSNLYAIDSSLLPGQLAATTPALTVTALADRCVTSSLASLLGISTTEVNQEVATAGVS